MLNLYISEANTLNTNHTITNGNIQKYAKFYTTLRNSCHAAFQTKNGACAKFDLYPREDDENHYTLGRNKIYILKKVFKQKLKFID